MSKLQDWLKSGKHLPDFLRDFHNQKNVFKWINYSLELNNLKSESHDKININFRDQMCYTIDYFLWYMAMHGYTLQRSRVRLDHKDIYDLVDWPQLAHKAMALEAEAEGKKVSYRDSVMPNEFREAYQNIYKEKDLNNNEYQ